MPRMHAIELLPDDAGCDVVRRDWQALRDAGLPSQLDHRGATNSPHVTVVAAPALRTEDEERAVELVAVALAAHLEPGHRVPGRVLQAVTNCFNEIYFEPLGIYSLLDVGINIGGTPFGLFCCENVTFQKAWSSADVEFLRQVGVLIGLALKRAAARQGAPA